MRASIKHARKTNSRGTFCLGDVRKLTRRADASFDLAYTMTAPADLTSEREVCAIARQMGRVIKAGGRAMIVSVPKPDCAVTQDSEWGCPRCFWKLRGIDKGLLAKMLTGGSDGRHAGRGVSYRVPIEYESLPIQACGVFARGSIIP